MLLARGAIDWYVCASMYVAYLSILYESIFVAGRLASGSRPDSPGKSCTCIMAPSRAHTHNSCDEILLLVGKKTQPSSLCKEFTNSHLKLGRSCRTREIFHCLVLASCSCKRASRSLIYPSTLAQPRQEWSELPPNASERGNSV